MQDASTRDRIYRLWDALADYDAAQVDAALDHLLGGLCDLVGAQNAAWAGFVRMAEARGSDPADGWRPPVTHILHPTEKLAAAIHDQWRQLSQRLINAAAVGLIEQAGSFRACRLCDLVGPDWFESDFYRTHYRECDREDAIYTVFPVNEDAESYFCVIRALGQPRFTEQERDILAHALSGLKWFHRQLLLSHGLLVAKTPLTPAERRVLQGLLTGRSEKQVAADLGQSYHTTHDYVTAIYRKFGVNNRPALMNLWLSGAR